MVKNKFGLFILLLTILFLASCDYAYDYTYQVTNQTNSEIKIELKTFQFDSIYSIEANGTQILFVTDHGIEGPKGPYFDDVANDLDRFVVTKSDTLISAKDYLDNSSWIYNDGLYSTEIADNEFE